MLPNVLLKREKYLLTFGHRICYHSTGTPTPFVCSRSTPMTPQKELEISGNFFTNPFAELVTEIMQARLNGSLRGADKEKKCVIYFKSGKIVFAVSNARSSRVFDILMRRNRITKEDLAKIPNF